MTERDWLYPNGDRPMCLVCGLRPVYLGGKCGPCYASKTCDEPARVGIAPDAPVVACSLDPGHDGSHDAPIPTGGRLTWRSGVERVPMTGGRTWRGTPDRDDSPSYRAAMTDAGRGGLLR